ncbi:hypothetical protein ACFLTP_09400 [Chloroflexota bacterium]
MGSYTFHYKSIVLFLLVCLVSALTSCMTPSVLPTPQAPSSPSIPSPFPTPNPSPSPSSPEPLFVIPEISQSAEQILRHYAWDYDHREWTIELKIPLTLYNHYKEILRPPTQNYSVYVTHPLDDAYISSIADELRRSAKKEGFNDLETLEFTAAFIQNFPYTADTVSTSYDDYPRYPIETLVDNGGDCEDTSILMASLLSNLHYEVCLIEFPDKHCALGVSSIQYEKGTYFNYNGDKYFYLETTNTGWGVGQMPEELVGVKAEIYDLTPTPIITHDWNGTIGRDSAELEITLQNLGSQLAYDVYIIVGFDADGDKLWNTQESDHFDLPTNQDMIITMKLQVPLEKHTRIVIQIIHNGYAVDKSHSEWFDT